jgi:arabinose-5-phosphate isomerase
MSFIESARSVIEIEQRAIANLVKQLNEDFVRACEIIMNCKGRVVVLGIGKSGHIGNKIAATLASTGTPAFAVNAGEASHGDFGMITSEDVVIAISYSGTTAEIIALLPLIKRLEATLISLCGKPASELALASDINLNVGIEREACPLGLAPTASTTATLAMGDALAIALLEAKGFTAEQFAFSHPGGALGKRLLLTIGDLMSCGNALPRVSTTASLKETIIEMTEKKLGVTTIVDANGILRGIFTDGDLRRTFERGMALNTTQIDSVMTQTPKTMQASQAAIEALEMMEQYRITSLVVIDEQQHPQGIIHMHHLLQAGVA